MRAKLILHEKNVDERNNIVEMKIWQLPQPTFDSPAGFKYSLVYIDHNVRVIGYDNAEGKGDHRHIKGREESYRFHSLRKLVADFFKDIDRYKGGKL
jgi:hypothetical protein